MEKHGVQINDLYAVVGKDRATYHRGENDVHYTEAVAMQGSPASGALIVIIKP